MGRETTLWAAATAGIESLNVADLQNPRRAFCRGDQLVRFIERRRHRLFDQHIDSRVEQTAADARVLFRRDGEAHGLHARGGERVDIRNRPRAEFRGDLPGALGIGVNDAGEFDAFEFAPHADMVASELAGADDSNANGLIAHDFALV